MPHLEKKKVKSKVIHLFAGHKYTTFKLPFRRIVIVKVSRII